MANIAGVGEEWDGIGELRTRMLATKLLTVRPAGHRWCEPNRPNCVNNSDVLKPLLYRMRDDPDDPEKLPILDDLKKEIGVVALRLSISMSDKEIYTTSVELKKLCSFVKRRAHRTECTKDIN